MHKSDITLKNLSKIEGHAELVVKIRNKEHIIQGVHLKKLG